MCGWFWQVRNRGRFWVEKVKCVSKHVHIIIVSKSLIPNKKSIYLYVVQCNLFFISVKFFFFKFLGNFSRDLKACILKTDFAILRFLELWERQSMSINLNYIAWENSLKLTWNKNLSVLCEALFYLKYLKFTCLELFLSLFRLWCKRPPLTFNLQLLKGWGSKRRDIQCSCKDKLTFFSLIRQVI